MRTKTGQENKEMIAFRSSVNLMSNMCCHQCLYTDAQSLSLLLLYGIKSLVSWTLTWNHCWDFCSIESSLPYPGEPITALLYQGEPITALLYEGGPITALLYPGEPITALLYPGGVVARIVIFLVYGDVIAILNVKGPERWRRDGRKEGGQILLNWVITMQKKQISELTIKVSI